MAPTATGWLEHYETGKSNGPSRLEALHIFTLFSFALAQPVLDILGQNPEFFVVHRTTGVDLGLLLAVLMVLLPGTALLIEVLAARVGKKTRVGLHVVGIAILVTTIANPPLKALPDSLNGLRFLAALFIGIFSAYSYVRWIQVRSFVTLLSPAILIFPGLFLLNSPALEIVSLPREEVSLGLRVSEVQSDSPIILVILDELPIVSLMDSKRRIDKFRYPNFHSLSQDGTWYRNATTVADSSTFAIPAILTGRYTDPTKIPIQRHYPNNLFRLLSDKYNLQIFETASRMHQSNNWFEQGGLKREIGRQSLLLLDTAAIYLQIILPAKVTRHLPGVKDNWMGFGDPHAWQHRRWVDNLWLDRGALWKRFVSSVDPGSTGPRLSFIHILLPHSPFIYLPSGEIYSEDSGYSNLHDGFWRSEGMMLESYYRHLLQLAYVDRLLGQLLTELKEVGIYEECLLVLLADHGISFRMGDEPRNLSSGNYMDIMSVPLFVKRPFQKEGRVDDREAELIDILPTIAEIIGFNVPWQMDGVSLLAEERKDRLDKRILQGQGRKVHLFKTDHETKYESLWQKLEWFGEGPDENEVFQPLVQTSRLSDIRLKIATLHDSLNLNTGSKSPVE